MEKLSKILIVTNIMCIVMLMVSIGNAKDWRTVSEEYIDILDICLDSKATAIDDLDETREEHIDMLQVCNEKINRCNDDWKWIYDKLERDCKDTIDIYDDIIDDYKEVLKDC